jgi:soluble lytic murein transglycosylase
VEGRAQVVDAMSAEARQDSTWVYWKARALLANGKPSEAERAEARQLLERIAGTRGFYEQLALEELGQRITVPPAPAPPPPRKRPPPAPTRRLNRALYAILHGPAQRRRARVELHHQPAHRPAA